MIGIIGMCLGRHGVNINQFEFGRNVCGGVSKAIIRVDEDVSLDILEELSSHEGIKSVRKIVF